MPSPFPGMDPYLEGDLWTSFHSHLAVEIARELSPSLRPRYAAIVEKRFIVESPEDEEQSIYADLGFAETEPAVGGKTKRAEILAPLQIATIMPTEVPHASVEIRDAARRKLITIIELLSPINKRGQRRQDYIERRTKILQSQTHLMEIDLVRSGKRVPMTKPLPLDPYFVFLSRAGHRPMTEIWPIAFKEPLPPLPIPLRKGEADLKLDLEAAFTAAYDTFNFDLLVDYSRPPEVPLPSEPGKWAEKRLRAAGLRP